MRPETFLAIVKKAEEEGDDGFESADEIPAEEPNTPWPDSSEDEESVTESA